jgi:hypothetical protein
MLEQAETELKKAQTTAVSAMDDLDPVVSLNEHAQVDDPV